MAVIDLDLSPADDQPAPRRFGRLGAVVVLCGLLLLVGPDVRVKPWITGVAQIPIRTGAWLSVSGDTLLVSGATQIAAFELGTGHERWRTDTGVVGGELLHHNGLLIASGADPAALNAGRFRARSAVIDRDTGTVLWWADGAISLHNGMIVLYLDGTVSLLREDGAKVWTVDGHGIVPVLDDAAATIVTLDKSTGELVERVLPSLIERRRASVPGADGVDGMWLYDGTLSLFDREGDILRFDTSTLTLLPPETADRFRVDCGRVWCMISEHTLVDKKTGATVHETSNWEYALSTDAGVVGLGILVGDGEPTLVRELYDFRSGASTDMDGWVALNLPPGAPVRSPGRAILLSQPGVGTSYLSLFDDTGLHRLGRLPVPNLAQCTLTKQILACRVGADLVRIWRLP